MTELKNYQQELSGVVLGHGTKYPVQRLDGLGLPGVRAQDAPLPWDEGEIPGVDRLEAREVVWEGAVKVADNSNSVGNPEDSNPYDDDSGDRYAANSDDGYAAQAMDALAVLGDAFDAAPTRATANAVTTLRIKMPGRPTRVLYGRPRRFDYDNTQLILGWVPFTASFRAFDPRFYDEAPTSLTLGLDISGTVGLTAPLVAPLTTAATHPSSRPGYLTVPGTAPTWPLVRIDGPCANPRVTNVRTGQSLGFAITLTAGQHLEVDTAPWNRTVLLNGANASGALVRGSRIDRFSLDPGLTEFRYNAVDATVTSLLTLTARAAWRSL